MGRFEEEIKFVNGKQVVIKKEYFDQAPPQLGTNNIGEVISLKQIQSMNLEKK